MRWTYGRPPGGLETDRVLGGVGRTAGTGPTTGRQVAMRERRPWGAAEDE